MTRPTIYQLVQQIFAKVQSDQGYAFISDGEIFDSEEELIARLRNAAKHSRTAAKILDDFATKVAHSDEHKVPKMGAEIALHRTTSPDNDLDAGAAKAEGKG